ncbi:ROK family protein [Streptacidiphilus monticola]|uniref:ROK family protein n=1 Tax=Streptacidiphilus monticola TaxID=2161674 RepID=A0ABW1FZE7_9ACTN
MRRQNLSLVLGTVGAQGPLSRADVAARTGLTRAAVSSLVDELQANGLIEEHEATPSGRVGRPGRGLVVSDHGPAGLGLEVGVGHLGVCLVDLRGEVRAWRQVEADNQHRSPERVLADLAELVGATSADGLRPVGAVLAVPGLLADAPGTVAHAPNLGWHDVDLAELWARSAPPGTPALSLENEANLGALAELWENPEARDFVHVSAEAGIGAALVIDGRLFRGARGWAGELGHVPVRPDGPHCACGARGCLEQYAGEAAVLRAAGIETDGRDGVPQLLERAERSEPRALEALRTAGEALGIALTGAVHLVDPQALVLGGAYAELAPWLLPAMRAELTARVAVRPWSADALTASALGRRGPLLGAARLTVRRILADPIGVLG